MYVMSFLLRKVSFGWNFISEQIFEFNGAMWNIKFMNEFAELNDIIDVITLVSSKV